MTMVDGDVNGGDDDDNGGDDKKHICHANTKWSHSWFWKAEDDADRQVKGYQGKGETIIAHLFKKKYQLWTYSQLVEFSLLFEDVIVPPNLSMMMMMTMTMMMMMMVTDKMCEQRNAWKSHQSAL